MFLAATTFFDDVVRDGIVLNAPMVTAACLIIATLAGLLVTAGLAGEAATRDVQSRMEPLLYTTPLSKITYLGGRFLSAFAVNSLLLAVVPITLAVWSVVPVGEAASFGPFEPWPYVRAYLMVAVPNAFIATALLFSLVILSRRPMIGYLGAALLFFNTAIQEGIVAGALGKWQLAKHLDPFLFIIGAAQWRSHAPSQRNALQLELEPALMTSRLLWLAVSLAALTLAYVRFRMAHDVAGRGWRWRRRAEALPDNEHPVTTIITPSRVRGAFDRATRVRQVVAIALQSFREMITSRAALLIPAAAWLAFNVVPELLEFGLGTPSRPNTGRLALLYSRFNVSGIAVAGLVAFFSGHLIWRERDAREHDVADVTPVPDIVPLLGKFAGLVLLIMTMQAALIATGILTQIGAGYYDFEPMLWVRVLFGLKLVDYLLLATLAMAVQVVVNHRYLGTALVIVLWVFPQFAADIGISHNLLLYASDPGVTYSDFNGFGTTIGPWLWFKLYWAGWAALLGLLARLYCVRGHDVRRLERLRERFTRGAAVVATAAVAVVVTVGGFIFYNTNILSDYITDEIATRRSVEYERRYGKYASLAQPILSATKLWVDLHPSQHRANIRGTYRLENRSGRAIDTIHLVTRFTTPLGTVAFDRPARATVIDRQLGYSIYTLAKPLQPGEPLRMDFELQLTTRGFGNRNITPLVASNGTLLEHRPDSGGRTWLPAVGYRPGVEIDNPGERRLYGLPPRPALPTLADTAARSDERGIERIDLETVIGTDVDQIAVAPGALRRTWIENGRRYFHYVTDAPIRNGFPILSARYAVQRARRNNVDIEVLHEPRHTWNVERIARAARASLDAYSRELGPYPHRQLRLVEFPITGGGRLTGHPGTVIWSEALAFAQPEADQRQIDFPFAVVAHEVAHQWWGNRVVPARVEGAPLVSESLAWYSAMNVVERAFGREHRERLMQIMRDAYLVPHETPQAPLLRANDWLAVYRTGALAMNTLRETIGAARVNGALRSLVDEFGSGKPPFATSLDLYRHLRAATPPASQPLLRDLFEEVTFWDLRVKTVRSERAAGGSYRVAMNIEAHKIKVAEGGRENEVRMDEMVDVGVFAGDKLLGRQTQRIRTGEQRVTLVVSNEPTSAAIDPDFKLLDRKREDNSKELAE